MSLIGLAALTGVAMWMARRGVLELRWMRRRGMNLVASRGDEPNVWLVAHLDTKSQPVPTLVRSAGFLLAVIGLATETIGAVRVSFGGNTETLMIGATIALVGAVPLMLSFVGDRSPGAFDNASGVATVLEAARVLIGQNTRIGVLLTDAEELGLAGARAWASMEGPEVVGRVMLNCDGVDDEGEVVAMSARRLPRVFAETIARASASCGVQCRMRRLVPGVLTDSLAFEGAGARSSVTFSRGTLWSLSRVHSRRDDLGRLAGTGIADTARLIVATVTEMARAPR